MKNKIGITMRYREEHNDYWINPKYIEFIELFNLDYICLQPLNKFELLNNLKQCDYLLLTGGTDLDSILYNEPLHEKSYGIRKEIDQLDFDVLEYAEKNEIPTFGICRGMQSMNIYFGGSMYQHIENHTDIKDNHLIFINKDQNFLYSNLKSTLINGNSYHHQACNKIGRDLNIIAKSEDGTIEAIEHSNFPMIGLQWHPEKLVDEVSIKIFKSFLDIKKK